MMQINVVVQAEDAKSRMAFHLVDSKRILAAVFMIMDADNTVVFSKRWGCYIENDVTGERMKVVRTKGVFMVKVKVWDGEKYVSEDIVIDSGAADNVMPKEVFGRLEMLEKQAGCGFKGRTGQSWGTMGGR